MRTSSVSRRGDMGNAFCCVSPLLHECCVSTFECVLPYPFDLVHKWKEGPVAKGWPWCHASFTLNEYLIKTRPFNYLSKALVLQSLHTQCVSAKQSVRLPDCRPLVSPSFHRFLFFLFCPCSHSHFPLPSICLCCLCCLSLWMLPFCRKTPFMSSLITAHASYFAAFVFMKKSVVLDFTNIIATDKCFFSVCTV